MASEGLEILSDGADEGRRLVLRADPLALADGPGWRAWAFPGHGVSGFGVGALLFAAALLTLYPGAVDRAIFLALALYFLANGIERRALSQSGRAIGEARWDARGVSLQTAAGTRWIARGELSAVVWEPIHWHGRLSRTGLLLGGQVALQCRDGERVVLARGTDNPALRALAERLSAELGLTMVERSDPDARAGLPALMRSPENLDQPLIARLGVLRRQWQRMPSYSDWTVRPIPGGSEIAIGGEDWRPKALAAIAEDSGTALITLLVLDFLRLPVYVWVALFHVVGALPAPTLPSLFDPVGLAAHVLACVPVARELYRAHRRRRLVIAQGVVSYAIGGRLIARIPIETIEEVRLEVFPRRAVRIIADDQQLVIADLPNAVDYEALVDQLPHLLPSGRRREAAE